VRRPAKQHSAARRSFTAGLRNANPLVLVAAAGLLMLFLLGVQSFVTSGAYTKVISEDRLLRRTSDDWGRVSWEVGHLKQSPPKLPAVYLVGGSTTRELITSEASLAAAIRQVTGKQVYVNDLASMNQSFGQSLAIAANLPAKNAVLVIGVNQARFTASPADNEDQIVGRPLLLQSTDLRTYVADTYGRSRYAYTILPGITGYIVSWVQENAGALRAGHVPTHVFDTHRYSLKTQLPLKRKQQLVLKWLKTREPKFTKHFDYNAAMLEELVRVAKGRGFTVVLLNLPLNEQVVGGRFNAVVGRYRALCRRLAAQYGVISMDPRPQAGLESGDFQDLTHLVEPGRVKFERALAAALVAVFGLADGGAAGGGGTAP
jgi:hypothetical protein